MTDFDLESIEESALDNEGLVTTEIAQAKSLLAIDVGSVNTRAMLFDLVEGRYRFLATGMAPTTAKPPISDASEGVRLALDTLNQIAGRLMFTRDEQMIIPSTPDGSGADHLAPTCSAGKPLKTVVVGLLDKVSVASALNLAHSNYTDIIEVLSTSHERQIETQIDHILETRPDLVLIAGGTDDGATGSVLKMVSSLGMALYLIPSTHRPQILYIGNPQLHDQITSYMEPLAPIHIAPNVRPSLSFEQLGPAQSKFNDIYRTIHSRHILGLEELNVLSGGHLVPTAHAQGRVIRFFSKIVPDATSRGVLGIDVGASHTTVAAGFNGDLRLHVINELGIGSGLITILKKCRVEDITRWLPMEIPPNYIIDYVQNKILIPQSLPVTTEDLLIEQALAREILQQAIRSANQRFPKNVNRIKPGMLPVFDPIVISGNVISNAPTTAQSLLIILDALQPTGIQQIILDKNNLSAALGSAIPMNPTLVAQLALDPISFLNLGYVISPISRAKPGSPVLRVRMVYEAGHENEVTVRQGEIIKIPLPQGQRATLYLDPLQRSNIGKGAGRQIPPKRIVGSTFGLVVDARGRPLTLPKSPAEQREAMQKWLFSLENGH